MSSKWLIVSVAGLGWLDLKARRMRRIAGLEFGAAKSAFPAVTCVAQASLRTGAKPQSHGMTSNGVFSRELRKAAFWEQSAALVRGPRIWDAARAAGKTVGMYFWQQSLGESIDSVISPAPIHKHHGGMIPKLYTQTPELAAALESTLGAFPMRLYWGPAASPLVGDKVIDFAKLAMEIEDPDIAFVYLPTLDYDLQRHGSAAPTSDKSFELIENQLWRLSALAEKQEREMLVLGDYAITPATVPPAFPNQTLREIGYFKTRDVNGMAYPDLFASRAFALCDHEVAHVYIRDPADLEPVRLLLKRTGDYENVRVNDCEQPWAHATGGELLLTATRGSWCAYPWWTNPREAPDYATHVDIHNKPGYDPCELFSGGIFPPRTSLDATLIRGTHGRESNVAFATTKPLEGITALSRPDEIGAALEKIFTADATPPPPEPKSRAARSGYSSIESLFPPSDPEPDSSPEPEPTPAPEPEPPLPTPHSPLPSLPPDEPDSPQT